MNPAALLYRFWNVDRSGTRYRGEPEPFENAIRALLVFRNHFPSDEAWIEPEAA